MAVSHDNADRMPAHWRIICDAARRPSQRGHPACPAAIRRVPLQSPKAVYACVHRGADPIVVRGGRKNFDLVLYVLYPLDSLDRILNIRLQDGARCIAAKNHRVALNGKVDAVENTVPRLPDDLSANLFGEFQNSLLSGVRIRGLLLRKYQRHEQDKAGNACDNPRWRMKLHKLSFSAQIPRELTGPGEGRMSHSRGRVPHVP